MHLLGLTGSIAMGKSHVARRFLWYGVPVFDSDAAVHRLFESGSPLAAEIGRRFEGTLDSSGAVNRKALGRIVMADQERLAILEGLVHPMVRRAQKLFLERCARIRSRLVVLDIPLLYETGSQRRLDAVAVAHTTPVVQRARALRRPGMSEERLAAILRKQWPAWKKRAAADFVVPSGSDLGRTIEAVAGIILAMRERPARAWPGRWS